LQAALAGRYDLDRAVGHGGMATVSLARDPKHNRMVAVKVLKPDVAASIGADRFLREIEIAARLQHPHVLTLIDSGSAAARGGGRDVHVTVTPRNGRTRIHVAEKLGALVGSYFGGLVGGWGGGGSGAAMAIGMGALNSPVAAVTLVIANLAAAYFTARRLVRNLHRKRLRALTSLIDRLAEHCADTATAPDPLDAPTRPPRLRA